MDIRSKKDVHNFFAVGINYKKTDASVRGAFAINNDQYESLLSVAPQFGLDSLFVLSTCNRTEVYGFAENAEQLMTLLCTECEGDFETLSQLAYVKNGWDAVEHLFTVSAGLDSQILGDYEILGQIKNAAKFSKEHGFISPFLERVVNSVIQSSKAVKTHTTLSSGTVSVSFAAIQYIKNKLPDAADKNILLIGTGKIGRNTCKNLIEYLGARNITLINRTEEKAQALADELGLRMAPMSELENEVKQADVILVATNAIEPVVLESHLLGYGNKLIVDLSVPCNVATDAKLLPNVQFADVDMLSEIKDETLHNRKAEVPRATAIINEHIAEFKEWYDMRRHVPMLIEVKDKLKELNNESILVAIPAPDDKIQKVINTLATKMRRNNTIGCHYIEALNEFIA